MIARTLAIVIALAVVAPAGALAQDEPPRLVQDEPVAELPERHRPALGMTIRPRRVRTGDVIRVRISAEARRGDDVVLSEQELAPFEVHRRREIPPVDRPGGRRRFVFELHLLALEPGDHTLPPISLRVVTADGETGVVRTHGRRIHVGAHLGNEPNARPRPPTQPVSVFEEDYTLLWVLGSMGALLLAALIGFFAARWWKRRPREAPPPPPPTPPWEVAIALLTQIQREKAKLIAESKQVELVDRVSDAVREYLGRRYDFNGLESTTDEVLTSLKKVKLRGVAHDDITALLGESDLVKFAKLVPDEPACDRMLEGAFKIVRATTPRPGATPVARPASSASGAKIVSKDGIVTIPISVHTIDEALAQIRSGASAVFHEHAKEPSFEGTIRVSLSSALRPSEGVTDALARVRADLAAELRTVQIASGRPARLIIEHAHVRMSDAARAGRTARFTILDDDGVRFEDRMPSQNRRQSGPPRRPAPAVDRAAPAAAAPAPAPSSAVTMPATDVRALVDPHAPTARAPVRAPAPALAQGASWSDPASPFAAEPEHVPAAPSEKTPSDETAPAKAAPVAAATADETKASPRSGRPPPPAPKRDVSRLVPEFFTGDPDKSPPLLRWITGLPRPVRYMADDTPVETGALASLGLTRGGVHERALATLRRAVPPGFAPTTEPAVLDDAGAATLLVLPEIVPLAEAWIVYPAAGEGLVVMREGAPSTREELVRLERAHRELEAPLFERPVRVSRRGFEPFDWPSVERSTNPGFGSPDRPVQRPTKDDAADGAATSHGDAFGKGGSEP